MVTIPKTTLLQQIVGFTYTCDNSLQIQIGTGIYDENKNFILNHTKGYETILISGKELTNLMAELSPASVSLKELFEENTFIWEAIETSREASRLLEANALSESVPS